MAARTTQKAIRELIECGAARDVRGEYTGDCQALYENYRTREKIMYSRGTYGINGAVWCLDSGELIAVPTRCTALFALY